MRKIMGIDSYMIPITISICLIAIAPIMAPDMNWGDVEEWDTPKMFPNAAISQNPSQTNDEAYFQQLDENIEVAKQQVRDLMAEHKANNP